ncbi:MAG: ATP-binding protein [Myxococcales bacterium]|jgi:signal transduction histidine kinase/CheY-like chemotaxis protein
MTQRLLIVGADPEALASLIEASGAPGEEPLHVADLEQAAKIADGQELAGALLDTACLRKLLAARCLDASGPAAEARAQSQKLESVGRLAGGIAHDFNNLLTSIISFSRFVMDDLAPGDPRRRDLVEVLKAADTASKLTSQLLAFSRQRSVAPSVIDLNGATVGISRVLRRLVGEQVELSVRATDRDLPVLFDPGQLDQLVMNLAINARDAMPDGGRLEISVDAHRVDRHPALRSGDYAALVVRDNGTGMSPEVRGRLFEPFFTTKGDKGTGLGLATCYGIVKQADGEIEVESAPGVGTAFTILLPITDATAERHASEAPAVSDGPVQLTGMALAVEDQQPILKTMSRSLNAAGFNVLEARSAEEAIDLVESLDASIDLLVTDVVLPGLSGAKLAHRLRESRPSLKVLMCSGYVGEADASDVITGDNMTFLPKPFTGAQLRAKVLELFT